MREQTVQSTNEPGRGPAPADPAGTGVPGVLEGFRRQVARNPSATALIVGGTRLTYGALDRASAALAGRLRRRGAGPGRLVCVRMRQTATAVIAMLGALRAGAAWAVVEPDQPPHRLRALLADTDCAVLVTAGPDPLPAGLPQPPGILDLSDLSDLSDLGDRASAGPVDAGESGDAEVPESAPVYVVCTSGSTGAPKGVMVSRAQLAASIHPRYRVYGTEPSTFVMAMRLSFDGMLGGMFWSFTGGHTLVLPDEKELRQVHELAGLARRHAATHLIVVPSYYRALLEESRLLPETLRLVVVAGEACTPELVRRHHRLLPGTRLVNEYGPTETTISCTVQPDPDPSWPRIPIGMPWAGAEAHVLDDRLRPVPAGERGELYIGGTFVALGYAGQPGRTAERFVADPFGRPGARLYRTGDVAQADASGALHYHGRTDDQVKLRGTRIELGEVEAALERHPRVGQAVVLHDTSGADEPRLVAFLAPASADAPLPSWPDLRTHCAEYLVAQAVPAVFRELARMPLNSSGKADRSELQALLRGDPAAPDGEQTGGAADGVDAPDDRVREVARVWAEVLQHEQTGPRDNFFAVGGSSLKVLELHKRLEQHWPGAVRVGELFDLTTITAQAEALTARLGGTSEPDDDTPTAYEL